MNPTMSDKSRAHEVLREALREINASESTKRAAEEVIARREAEQATDDQESA